MKTHPAVKTSSTADLAFSVVVLVSYFAVFASIKEATIWDILLMAGLGIIYILVGIYGYAYCARSDLLIIRLGYFLVQLPLGGLIVSISKGGGFNAVLLLPLAGHAVLLLSELWVYVVNAGILLVYIISVGSYTSNWSDVWSGIPPFLAGLIFIIVFTQSLMNEERARKEVERLVRELQAANQGLREYALQVEELTIAEERNRIAREIHDGLGHSLTALHMEIQAARAVMGKDPAKADDLLSKAQQLTQETLADVRASVSALHADAEENLPLIEMIARLLNHCKSLDITTDLRILGTPRILSPQAHVTLYRATQESINNVIKHARARQVWVSLDYREPARICLVIQDDGIGVNDIKGGFGILGMRERVNLLNGSLKIKTAIGEGFRVEVSLPA